MEDDDFIMRQIKSFAECFGAVLGKGKARNEVVFEQQQNQKGRFILIWINYCCIVNMKKPFIMFMHRNLS
ncbi:hypothetical protein [Companilactobacillus bobalius]|uniref:Uncharacterized protein n=1 Tax=Companilactobacillus bobalius TaxID=2801451 RepID=A0A202FCQ3_9LACO|nr:hypothetical protein [Companilactobacillus bobalius]GEO58525.1 hypothetical protein LBO01_16540 [Companilactobacillus paralimentarius]KAE9557534.1 hypothetical protein ATN92_15310 [Companilactobacillus bobalius]KAE9561605.1 hypothetical protein ATN92_05865 [Companilactobacillus bobalius]KAE9563681.1 hypothetical protein ATN92_02795 [Companilactobacillus bobalius]OVE98212.1 hypothetical protein LKACC16343_01095 [Companilactobacillus bobalius]